MLTREECLDLDQSDPLAGHRKLFHLPDGVIYLDGNSLGALPRTIPDRLESFVRDEWGTDLIRSWNINGWFDSPNRVGARLAPIVGAEPDEVIVCDNLSVNIFKMLAAAIGLRPDRRTIVIETGNFPSDHYITDSVAATFGLEVRTVDAAEVTNAVDDDVAVVHLSHVDYRTGELLDMPAITAATRAAGAISMWDLAHSAGALEVELSSSGVDFAVGCGYKYLNGGPGAPAFIYANRRHHGDLRQPLTGWTGHAAPFALDRSYEPGPGLTPLRSGTPAMLSMVAFEEALRCFDGVDFAMVRAKSRRLGELFVELVDQFLPGQFELVGPADSARRGSQVSFQHADGYPIMQALIARGVIGDFRAPDRLRFGFAPLYVRHVDVWDAVDTIASVLATREWDDPRFRERSTVT